MTKEERMDVEASFDDNDLDKLTVRVKRVFDIRDRKYGFPSKSYTKCFIGSEAVTTLVEEGIADAIERLDPDGLFLSNGPGDPAAACRADAVAGRPCTSPPATTNTPPWPRFAPSARACRRTSRPPAGARRRPCRRAR